MSDETHNEMNDELMTRYSRHIMLDDIGEEGQQRLAGATALIVGLGGLGSPAALYLAAAGVGELLLCDDDTVELANLQRQIIHGTDAIGWQKTDSARRRLANINPHSATRAYGRVNDDNVDSLVAQASVVIDGSDNYATRHLINRACARHKKPLVFGAAIGFDGQLSVFDTSNPRSPCYNCLFSEDDAAEDVPCAQLGVFAPLVGIIGAMQAAEAIKIIACNNGDDSGGDGSGDNIGNALIGRLLLLDARAMRWRDIELPRDTHCKVCHAR